MRKSRRRVMLPRAESQKRLNRFKLFRDGPNLSRFDACSALASSRFRLFDPMPRERRGTRPRLAAIAGCASWATTHVPGERSPWRGTLFNEATIGVLDPYAVWRKVPGARLATERRDRDHRPLSHGFGDSALAERTSAGLVPR